MSEFHDWLRGTKDMSEIGMHGSEGGFLVPEFMQSDLPGFRPALFRFVGRLLRKPSLVARGQVLERTIDLIRAVAIDRKEG